MIIDFTPVRNKEMTVGELGNTFSKDDLRAMTNQMIDKMQSLIADCTDEDVVFVPADPEANDTFAEDEADADLAWTLGHVVVHATASSEESAFLAAELARGVENHGRSRSEIPWETVTTIVQCRERLEESRRMRLATLEIWPDAPYSETGYTPWPAAGFVTAKGQFILGLGHDQGHLGQIKEIVRQAKDARGG